MALVSARNPHDALIAFHGSECVSLIELLLVLICRISSWGGNSSGRLRHWFRSRLNPSLIDHSASRVRVASRDQIQLPISFEHHREWFAQFAAWWEYGFRSWKQRNPQDACLNFLRELGLREQAITGADGEELSERREKC
jgi:hypothetical protein